jgi:DNA-binding transcriptional regulator YhcF (GntR family)
MTSTISTIKNSGSFKLSKDPIEVPKSIIHAALRNKIKKIYSDGINDNEIEKLRSKILKKEEYVK